MSLEVWGDDDGAGEYEHLLDAGWWDSDQVKEVTDAIQALYAEQIYEDCDMRKGISVRFICRLSALRVAAGLLDGKHPLATEAAALFASKTRPSRIVGMNKTPRARKCRTV